MSTSGTGWNFNWGGLGGTRKPTLEERIAQIQQQTQETQAQTRALAQQLNPGSAVEQARGLQELQSRSANESLARGVRGLELTEPFRDRNSERRVTEYTGKTEADTAAGLATMEGKTKNAQALLEQLGRQEGAKLSWISGDKPLLGALADYTNGVRGGTQMDMLREIDRLNQPSPTDRLMDLAQIAAPLALAFL